MVVLEIVWKRSWILDPKICTYPVYTSDPAEGTTLSLRLGEAVVPNPGKNCYLKIVRFYIPNLPYLVSPFLLMLIWPGLRVNWLHLGEYHEKLRTNGVWKEVEEQDVRKKGELATIFDKFLFPSWKRGETAKQSKCLYFYEMTWYGPMMYKLKLTKYTSK